MKCPLCHKKLNKKLIANFYYCPKCEIAVRLEKNMPAYRHEVYNEFWCKEQTKNPLLNKKANYLVKIVKKLKNVKNILDIGCGVGILVDKLNKANYKSSGIDSSKEAICFAKKNFSGEFHIATANNFKPKNKYDLVIATQLIEHLNNPDDFLKNAYSLLKPRKYLLIETPNLKSWDKKSNWRKKIGGMHYGIDHRFSFKPKGLTNYLNKNNFEIIKLFTKTYAPTIYFELMKNKTKNIKKIRHNSNKKQKLKNNINIKDNLYEKLIYSNFFELLFYIPNKISELNQKGNHLIAIAQKKD